MPSTIRLLGSRVLLAPIKPIARYERGVIIPAHYVDPTTLNQYRVLAVGPGRRSKKGIVIAPEVQPGDFVLLDGSSDHQTLYDGRKIVDASQLLAKWSGQP